MHTQIFSIIFLFGGVYFRYSDTSSWESNTTIIEDISKAFLKITNETDDVLTKMIPEMYDLNVTDPPFVFKLPHKDGAVLVIKRRSDFLDPQFPNLTTSNMQLMNERKHTEVISSDSQRRNPQYIRVDHMEGAGKSDNDWREMGLVGWSGEISEPIELSDLDEMNVDENYYSSEIVRYPKLEPILSNSMRDNGPRTNKITRGTTEMTMMVTETEVMEESDEGARVYLARVNDPFGYSTSWELRNSSELSGNHEDRPKRDVVRLYSMIKCSTGCEPLLFQGYGCYCGFQGAGFPVDGVDRCCKLHDKCYEHSNCISYLEYFVPYIWKCYRGKPLCAVDHGEWGSPRSCAARLCYCDMRLSRCLRRFECPRQRAACKSSPVRQLHRFLFP